VKELKADWLDGTGECTLWPNSFQILLLIQRRI